MTVAATPAPTRTRPPGPPLGPRGVAQLLVTLIRRDKPPARMLELTRDYPRIASIGPPRQPVYLVTHPDLIRQVLVASNRSLEKGPALTGAGLLLGDGLLTLPGLLHKPRRRLVNPSFHHERIAGYAEAMVQATDELHREWATRRPGLNLDMAQEMSALTLSIVGRALFGAELAGESDTVYRSLEHAMLGWEKTLVPGGDRLLRLPLPVFKRMWAAKDNLDALVARLVRRSATTPGDDLVSGLLASLTEDEVRHEAMTLLLAGHETTANALTWCWHLLSGNPTAAEALHAELDGLGHAATYADLPALPWATACIAETLRLYPPAWILERLVTEDIELDGFTIEAGAIVLASQYAAHRDPRWWDRPEQFDPSRWITADGRFDEDAPGQPRGAWFPFGAGTRQCIGESFAWSEAILVLARLAPHWAPVSQGDPKLHAAVTLRPEGGLPMRLLPVRH
jgi:cytochrome P450